MPVTEVAASLILLRLSEDLDGSTGVVAVVCETDSEAGIDTSVTETQTKRCGTLVAVQSPIGTITLNGVVDATPDAGEASLQQLIAWANARTKLFIEYLNESDGGDIDEGAGIYMQGVGHITSVRSTSAAGDTQKFSLGISFSGPINTTLAS